MGCRHTRSPILLTVYWLYWNVKQRARTDLSHDPTPRSDQPRRPIRELEIIFYTLIPCRAIGHVGGAGRGGAGRAGRRGGPGRVLFPAPRIWLAGVGLAVRLSNCGSRVIGNKLVASGVGRGPGWRQPSYRSVVSAVNAYSNVSRSSPTIISVLVL